MSTGREIELVALFDHLLQFRIGTSKQHSLPVLFISGHVLKKVPKQCSRLPAPSRASKKNLRHIPHRQ
jgi:hypothetical protein